MKTSMKILPLLVLLALLYSCSDKVEETYTVQKPVYMSYSDMRSAFKVSETEPIVQPGKIYFKDNYIFVNEYQKGIHVVNNADPENPVVEKFIEIPGNVDMAIKGNILYADSYVDLLSIDISDLDNIVEVDRDTNIFPYIIPDYEHGILYDIDESQGVIVGYKTEQVTEEISGETVYYNRFDSWSWERNQAVTFDASLGGPSKGSASGTGGSMARFTIYDNYLYVIDNYNLNLFDITTLENPEFSKEFYVGWNIETLFPYQNKLFIGSMTGMYIYDLSVPQNPEYISMFAHAMACDPVVVEGDLAYVTLRAGNLCGATSSKLDVIDLSDIQNPTLLSEYNMEEPYGLGIDDSTLFVCDGNAGLKIYNASNPKTIDDNLIKTYPAVNAFDVIPLGDVLVMIGIDGLYQYDYSNLDSIKQLSHIAIYNR